MMASQISPIHHLNLLNNKNLEEDHHHFIIIHYYQELEQLLLSPQTQQQLGLGQPQQQQAPWALEPRRRHFQEAEEEAIGNIDVGEAPHDGWW